MKRKNQQKKRRREWVSRMSNKNRLMLLQTTTTRANATILIGIALESTLSACVQQINIQSHYVWHNAQNPSLLEVCNENEILLSFKVFKQDFKDLRKLILQYHTYKIPEIIGIKLYKVSKSYQKWCKKTKLN